MNPRLRELIAKRGEIWARMQAITAAARDAGGRDLTAEEIRNWDQAHANLEAISEQIRVAETEARTETELRAARPGRDPRITDPNPGASRELGDAAILEARDSYAEYLEQRGEFRPQDRSLSLGRWLRGLVVGDWTGADAERSLSSSIGASGGFTVPTSMAAGIIDRMRAQARLLQAGAKTFPMSAATVAIPKLASGATASWLFEGDTVSASDPTFAAENMTAKLLSTIIKVPMALFEDSPYLETALRNELSKAMALEIDRAGIYGLGASGEPLGIVNTPGVGAVAAVGAITDYSDFLTAAQTIADANGPEATNAILSNRTHYTIAGLKTGIAGDNTPLPRPAALANLRFLPTSQILTNEGGGGNESRIILGGFEEVLIGVRTDMTIRVLNERYADQLMVGLLVYWRGDIAIPRPDALCMLNGVTS